MRFCPFCGNVMIQLPCGGYSCQNNCSKGVRIIYYGPQEQYGVRMAHGVQAEPTGSRATLEYERTAVRLLREEGEGNA